MANKTSIKVSVIGTGLVGSTIAYTMMIRGVASDIVMVDRNKSRAEGEAMDIAHGAPFAKAVSVRAGEYSDTANSDVIVITAGASQKPGQTRIDLVALNATIMRDVAQNVAKYSPNAVLLVVSNPVDVMAYVAQQATGFPRRRVIGTGTVLDSSRFRYLLSQTFGIAPYNIHGYVLGEHGDSEFAAWSLVNIAGMDIEHASKIFGKNFTEEMRLKIENETKNAAYEVINRKGATDYGIGMVATRIVETIIRDERAIITVSSLLCGEYGIEDVYLSLPTILGENGVEQILTLDITNDELAKLQCSAEVLRKARMQLS